MKPEINVDMYKVSLTDIRCQHQFFETNKRTYGVQVMCAICSERRQLLKNGLILVYNKDSNEWEELC